MTAITTDSIPPGATKLFTSDTFESADELQRRQRHDEHVCYKTIVHAPLFFDYSPVRGQMCRSNCRSEGHADHQRSDGSGDCKRLDNGSHYNPNVVILRRRFPLLLRINVDVFIVEATSGGTHHGLESFSALTRLFKQDVNPALIHREFHVSLCQEHPYQVDNIENVNNNNHQHAKLAFHSQSRWGMQPSAKHQYPLKILQFLTLQFPRET